MALLYSRNKHNTVNQLYFNKTNLFKCYLVQKTELRYPFMGSIMQSADEQLNFIEYNGMKLEINHGKRNEKKLITWRLNNMLLKNQWVNEEIKKEI